jgi:hypothetical protein
MSVASGLAAIEAYADRVISADH